jgi:DNA-binding ferritin-like protein
MNKTRIKARILVASCITALLHDDIQKAVDTSAEAISDYAGVPLAVAQGIAQDTTMERLPFNSAVEIILAFKQIKGLTS